MYDLIIIGGGPAGISAAIYAARYKLNFILLTETLGGWLNEIHQIENYPGFKSISGFELIEKYKEQLNHLEVQILYENVVSIMRSNLAEEKTSFTVTTNSNKIYLAKTAIIASGSKKRNLYVPGEKEFFGKGVSYCAICDAMFFKNKRVAVVGGANSAVSAALHLAKIADKVYLIYRKEELRADEALVDSLKREKNIEIIFSTNITKINGKESLESIELDKEYDNKKTIGLDGLFIEIGLIPITQLVEKIDVELDTMNQIKIDDYCQTNIQGVFAAGDVTNGQGGLKQFVTALASGAIAATSANKYLKKR